MKRVHYSSLRQMARSPQHYVASVDDLLEQSRAMRIGSYVHQLVLGPQPGKTIHLFEGEKRIGKAWDAFSEREGEIVTLPEAKEAELIARAVSLDANAQMLLANTEREKPLQWESNGMPCATGGLDAIGEGRLIDLKTTSNAEPRKFARHIFDMGYPAQLAWYQEAARANGLVADELYIIGVEVTAPYAVTCYRLTPPVVEFGGKCIAMWMEKLRGCLENDFWPGYTQAILDLELPAWMGEVEDE